MAVDAKRNAGDTDLSRSSHPESLLSRIDIISCARSSGSTDSVIVEYILAKRDDHVANTSSVMRPLATSE
jgi:hypothetical protein